MTDAGTPQVIAATRRWLAPVIYVLLRSGITWREFCELAKSGYVDVATARFGKRGRPTNVSRTAMLTGLTRRDVRLIRERLASPAAAAAAPYASKASQILSAWHLEPRFRDARGKPARLRLQGPGATFEELLKHCGAGDVRPTTVLKELVSAGVVRQGKDGRLQALARNYIPQVTDEQLVRLWGTVLADVANVYVHNMSRSPRTPTRFERAAKNERVPRAAEAAFRKFLEREGQAFLERIDAWLAQHQLRDGDPISDTPTTRMGAGVYQIHDD
ncbi:MAG TPA: DUF6502 family protein [Steroidobacteraceae bacterium]|jgi:hypothetical protein|nr:DUF6502 family protein [Steroidobacteraceae bacterium]